MHNTNKTDIINICLIFFSFCIASFFPKELLLFSYAILGPAHYLTQISWLKDRNFFVKNKNYYGILFLGMGAIFIPYFYMEFLIACFIFALFVNIKEKLSDQILYTMIVSTPLIYLIRYYDSAFLVFLLTTLIHVFLFTLLFMIYGSIKSRSFIGFISAGIFLIGGIVFFFLPTLEYNSLNYVTNNFGLVINLYENFLKLFDSNTSNEFIEKTIRFAAFAYTYHYLNWFSKVKVIGWYNKDRGLFLIVAYLFFITLYLIDYKTGFWMVVILSFVHVFLEFPLNWISIREIINFRRYS